MMPSFAASRAPAREDSSHGCATAVGIGGSAFTAAIRRWKFSRVLVFIADPPGILMVSNHHTSTTLIINMPAGSGTPSPPQGLYLRLYALERLPQALLLLVRQRRPQHPPLEWLQLGQDPIGRHATHQDEKRRRARLNGRAHRSDKIIVNAVIRQTPSQSTGPGPHSGAGHHAEQRVEEQ